MAFQKFCFDSRVKIWGDPTQLGLTTVSIHKWRSALFNGPSRLRYFPPIYLRKEINPLCLRFESCLICWPMDKSTEDKQSHILCSSGKLRLGRYLRNAGSLVWGIWLWILSVRKILITDITVIVPASSGRCVWYPYFSPTSNSIKQVPAS